MGEEERGTGGGVGGGGGENEESEEITLQCSLLLPRSRVVLVARAIVSFQ